jgi:hypothetical protein
VGVAAVLIAVAGALGGHWVTLGPTPAGWLLGRVAMLDRCSGWAVVVRAAPTGTITSFALAQSSDGGRHWTLVRGPA